ncbi:hypothetical protein [Amycolatopsis saalfeldensis]|uniref:Fur family transcriptional regulator, ferric uptake regulator n=1 Tax=Amycolatopsis saalfeldensis TaxID=394193 RepID=A0A1H8YL84_9PSEU|nr:hypothetical protein SAMN04489732_12361 [Amycolatopsis saalfeldensis]
MLEWLARHPYATADEVAAGVRGLLGSVSTQAVEGPAPCLEPSTAAGFVIDEAEVVFWGLCSDCAKPS